MLCPIISKIFTGDAHLLYLYTRMSRTHVIHLESYVSCTKLYFAPGYQET